MGKHAFQPIKPENSVTRRSFLLGMGSVIAGYGALRYGPGVVGDLLNRPFEFEPLGDLAGFRRITGGQSSRGATPFVGLDPAGQDRPMRAQVRARLCELLFKGTQAGAVRVASFSDYYCPYCRVLTKRLAQLEAQGAITVTWHEWPLLGLSSRNAAMGAIAAKQQGAHGAFHQRLMRGRFLATEEYLVTLARDLNMDAARFVTDFHSKATQRVLAQSNALARIFGFVGTPSLVVGRTAVQGAIPEGALQRLIAQERNEGPMATCG